MPLSVAEFSSRLVSSGLMVQPALTEFVSKLPAADQPSDGEQLAKRLVKQGLLTLYQAQQIYAGKLNHLVLGNYVVVDKLGQGGMGLVLKAVHRRMDRTVALKVLSPDAVKTPGLVERFHREVKAAAKLEHPHIVTAFDADEANGTHFLVMQFVDGKDLSVVVRKHGPLTPAQAVEYLLQAAQGLEYAHRHGVIHRDIKPGNLLLSKDGTVKILDMGLARIDNPLGEQQPDHSLTGTGTVMGTVDYMSPEQALNTKHADARSDQYSLGITLYFLLTGKPAYAGDTAMEKLLAHREAPLPSLPSGRPGVATPGRLDELNAIFHKMIAKQPADRYASMTDVIAALAALQSAQVDQPKAAYAPMSTPALPSAATQPDQALAAFLQQPSAASATKPATKATPGITLSPVSTAEEPTLLGSGAVEDTATTLRRPPSLPAVRGIARWIGITAGAALGVGMLAFLAITLVSQLPSPPKYTGPLTQSKNDSSNPATAPAASADDIDYAGERKAAEWVLSVGGAVGITTNGEYRHLSAGSGLPHGPFNLLNVQLAGDKINDADLAQLRDCRLLTGLTLEQTRVNGAGLKHLQSCSQLRSLWINGAALTDAGVIHCPNVETLDQLNLSGTSIGDAGLSHFRGCEQLNTLDLSATHITDAGLVELQGMTALARIRLSGTQVSDVGLERLVSRSSLRDISLKQTAVTGSGVEQLAAALPRCRIEWDGGVIEPRESTPGWQGWPADAPPPAIAPFDAAQARKHQEEWAAYLKVPVEWENSLGMKFRLIPPGEFLMGSTEQEIEAVLRDPAYDEQRRREYSRSEAPQHKVILTQPIYLATNEVLRSEYEQVMGTGPTSNGTENTDTGLPMENVSWFDTTEFSIRLSHREKRTPCYSRTGDTVISLDGEGYRLPREAEWEFACRAGTVTRFVSGDRAEDLAGAGWFTNNADWKIHRPGELPANPFGLHDLHGNLWEWVQDGWDPTFYTQFRERPAINPGSPFSGSSQCVMRGGSWGSPALHCRSSNRYADPPEFRHQHISFRVAVSVDTVQQALRKQPDAGWHGWPSDAPKPAIAPFDAAQARKHQEEWAAYLKVPVEYTNSLGMKFRLIPPGEFLMGSTPQQIEGALPFAAALPEWKEFVASEGPQHRVVLTQPFYLGTHEVTQQEYAAVTQASPSFFSISGQGASYVSGVETSRFPVEMVNRIDATAFCNKLSQHDLPSAPATDKPYRLPTEAEWEFACRAGTITRFWNGDDEQTLPDIAWYGKNSGTRPHPTGELTANPFGLFDMSGNVREWVQDEWSPTFYAKFQDQPAIDPVAPYVNGTQRVFRGGDFDDVAIDSAASSGRYAFVLSRADYAVGIRLALSVDAVKRVLPQAKIPCRVNLAAHRAALDWVRGVEGTLEVRVGDKPVTIKPKTPYPADSFELVCINLTRAVISDPDKLKPLVALPPGFDVFLPEVYSEAKSAQALSHLRNADMAIVMNVNHTVTRGFGESLGDHPIRYLVFLKQELKPGSLAALRNLPKLELLLLKACTVSPEVLREVEELPHLTMLNLESSTLTGEHLRALSLPRLLGLSIWGTAVTAADLVEFQRRHPRVGLDGIALLQDEFQRLKQKSSSERPAVAPKPAIAPFDAAQARKHQEDWAAYLKVPVEWENSLGMKFRLIPPGEHTMGLTAKQEAEILPLLESKGEFRELILRQSRPAHRVYLTRPFYLLREDVTAGWYQTLLGNLPKDAAVARPEDPLLQHVSWHKAIEFCNRLSEREGWNPAYELDGTTVRWSDAVSGARLPTEAEWEFACRAGTETLFFFGNGTGDYAARSKELLSYQRWLHNPAAPANPFGLFDLYAGADEWCWDHVVDGGFPQNLLSQGADPVQSTGAYRVKRGGTSHSDFGGDLLQVTSYSRQVIHGDPNGAYDYSGFGRVVVPVDSVRQSLKITGPALPKHSSADEENADRRTVLNFDTPSARVELPILDDRNGPWTLEAWVRPAEKLNKMATIIAAFRAPRGMGLSLFEEQLEAAISMADQPTWATAKTGRRLDPSRFHHVAAVYQAPRLTVFLNGEPVGQANVAEEHAPSAARFCLGGYNDGDSFSGLIDEVRISNSARYAENFTALRRLKPDAETLALYHFDEGAGEVLKDSSGNDHHGKITGAKWVIIAKE